MVMNEQEILEGFAESIEQFVGVPASEVTPGSDLTDDLEIDSLSMVEIVVDAQDKFGVEIPDEELKNLRTVQDVIGYIQRAQNRPVSA